MSNLICLLVALAFVGNGPDRKIMYFRMDSCPACKMIQPAIEELDNDGWAIRSVDIIKDPQTAKHWGVAEIPTLIVVESGQEVERIVGSLDHVELKSRLTGTKPPSENNQGRPSRKLGGSKDRSTIGANFPSKESVAGPNYPSDDSIFGPNHPSSRPREDRDDPFALFGENHPFYYNKKHLQPRTPSRNSAEHKAAPQPSRIYLPPGTKLPELPETMTATVRIRIKYEDSESVGTGTVIDIDGDEALVLTCGHLFHDEGEERRIVVELFLAGKVMEVPGTLVHFRNDELDLGFIKFHQSSTFAESLPPKIPILPKGESLHEKDLVFSIGCDGGAVPSRRDTVISRLNRFIGPSNIEIAGAPVQGRSGGGLFDVRGRLIGVCIAADNESDEGLFVGPEAIHEQLEKLGLNRLLQN